jgi:2-polyprenyl-3-methyl-5-hydroxy-6-metoxy-1,4-benzoquinol methylase
LKAIRPEAELVLARYSSMYDPGGWGNICAAYDQLAADVNKQVGGVTFLGELGKPALYQALAESAVLWYPGIVNFGETSCIAAIESQACGTPLVASYKGALPETAAPAHAAGHLIRGDAMKDASYQKASVQAVADLLDGCKNNGFAYRKLQKAGREHVTPYTYAAIAAEWDAQVDQWFAERYEGNRLGVLRQLLHEDDHVAAKLVAEDVLDYYGGLIPQGSPDPQYSAPDEAKDAAAFCDYVIAGKDHTAEQYGDGALEDPIYEGDIADRLKLIANRLRGKTRVLDVASGNGAHALRLARVDPNVQIVGVDFSAQNIEKATATAIAIGVADRVTFLQVPVYDFDTQDITDEWRAFITEQQGTFDAVFIGEFLEHVANYAALINSVETACQDGATIIYTCPHGPMVDLLSRGAIRRRGHVHRFAGDDLQGVFGQKADVDIAYLPLGYTIRSKPIGHWLIQYRHEPGHPTGTRPLATRILRTRPKPRLSVGIIAKNAAADLARCLNSVWSIADEIVIGDTGSTDNTAEIAAEYGARVLPLPAVEDFREGFSGARNAVLDACTGEWFLWIDADEILTEPGALWKYIEAAGPYRGFALKQTHVYLDMAPTFDRPVRIFKRDGLTKFYGCVHEQPQMGDANTDIMPALEVGDMRIAHTGYLTEDVRRKKMLQRNLPLLERDREVFPERELGHVLVVRDLVNLADYEREAANGEMTAQADAYYRRAIELFTEHLSDPTHRYHDIARSPWYDKAVAAVGGWEMEVAVAGKFGGLGESRAKAERVWVRTPDEYTRIVEARVAAITRRMAPVQMKVDPDLMHDAQIEDATGVPV